MNAARLRGPVLATRTELSPSFSDASICGVPLNTSRSTSPVIPGTVPCQPYCHIVQPETAGAVCLMSAIQIRYVSPSPSKYLA